MRRYRMTPAGSAKLAALARKRFATHGHATRDLGLTPEYRAWCSMIRRCYNSRSGNYHLYGAMGITVCDTWRRSFASFLADMGRRPTPRHTLDRKNTNGNYEPGNCRWATRREQQQNRRVNVVLTMNGQTLCVAEWARRYGITRQAIHNRLKAGWSIADAITKPSRKRFRKTTP